MSRGSLVVAGTGLRAEKHITAESKSAILDSDVVYYLIPDPFSKSYISRLRSDAIDLSTEYTETDTRRDFYRGISLEVVDSALSRRTCFVVYGHPAVLADAARMAVTMAREKDIPTEMLPGISARDCFASDLNIDLVNQGVHEYEATNLVNSEMRLDPTVGQLIWQIGLIGNRGWPPEPRAKEAETLFKALTDAFGKDHKAIIYEASFFDMQDPRVEQLRVGGLTIEDLTPATTLYVPPLQTTTSS